MLKGMIFNHFVFLYQYYNRIEKVKQQKKATDKHQNYN